MTSESIVETEEVVVEVEVPEYTYINYSEYQSEGVTGRAYRVQISSDATEEELFLVFDDLTAEDGYHIHTVWFYEEVIDVEVMGFYTVGMIEEELVGSTPTYTAVQWDKETLADMRAQFELEAATLRSISDDSFGVAEAFYSPDNEFLPTPIEIFSTTASENGLAENCYYIEGVVTSIESVSGYDHVFLDTEYGPIAIGSALISLPDVSEDDVVTVYFQYQGWSGVMEMCAGIFVYHE